MKLQLLLILAVIFFAEPNFCSEEAEKLLKLIQDVQKQMSTFKVPENAYEYKPKTSENSSDFGEFDFIIIGAGSAGAILANRLTEIKNWNVLLLEAGSFGNEITDIPQNFFALPFTDFNWGYYTEPQNFSCLGMKDQKCNYPRGRGIGGSSLINAMMHVRASKYDFDKWKSNGNPGWGYEDVLPYFQKAEHVNTDRIFQNTINPKVHGYNGPLNIEFHYPSYAITETFLSGNRELGVRTTDYNSEGIGASSMQMTTINGSREDTGKAYIRPVMNRKNLKIALKAYVVKILITAQGEAEGIEFTQNGKLWTAKAGKEVILSAGSINSPTILMHSGIGPKEHLESLKIQVKKDLPVGENLRDHPNCVGFFFAFDGPKYDLKEAAEQYVTNGTGIFTAVGYESSIALLPKMEEVAHVEFAASIMDNIEQVAEGLKLAFNYKNETVEDLFANVGNRSLLNVFLVTEHVSSKGSVYLKTNNPFDYPKIDPNFLSNPKDIDTIYEGLQYLLKLNQTKAFKEAGVELLENPLRACKDFEYKSKDYWMCFIRQTTMHLYHPVGTCKMGPKTDPETVVDKDCKVHGITNLRVIDASVIPFTLTGHPNAVVIMMAEKMADQIKNEHTVQK